jgi:hypothetical protein
MSPLPFAHLGHVLIDLPIFFGPVAVLAGWITLVARRDRRRTAARATGGDALTPARSPAAGPAPGTAPRAPRTS